MSLLRGLMSRKLNSLASEIVDVLNCGVLVVKPDHTIVMANQWLLEASRLDSTKVAGEKLAIVFELKMT